MSQVLTLSRSRSTRKGARRAEALEGASEYSSIGRLADRAALALIRHQDAQATATDEQVLQTTAQLLTTPAAPTPGKMLRRPFRGVVGFNPIELVEEFESTDSHRDWLFDELEASFQRILQRQASPGDYDSLLSFLTALSAATLQLSDEALTSKSY